MPTRDPKRIPVILKALKKVWSKNPDWRLGQVVTNMAGGVDPFYLTDEEMLKALEKASRQ